ncbi:hypothetical protein [Holospora curviuscula]|uniref:Uncharacterized protein n=1 Tax=Holospora curviuscula TaxID=1082868 RepID=A0A2S5R8B8_9PROT|nr:hypothetical protein [Holospora curviuscula]PPE03574.1 hypothetical protein HCUR_01001 [Holospora curviuscula]
MLPKNFPTYFTLHSCYRSFRIKRIWEKVLITLVKIIRIKAGESKNPSDRRIDSHSVKITGPCEQSGIDGGKKIKDPKCHSVVDTQGNFVHGTVYDANHSRGGNVF